MGSTCSSARLAISTNRDKEETLKALAAELGYILHPKSQLFASSAMNTSWPKYP